VEAAEMLATLGMPAWKIASGEIGNEPLLEYVASTGLPVIVSTGLSAVGETEALVQRLQAGGCAAAVLQCTTAYPCAPETVNLAMIEEYRRRLGCPVGLSDHSGQIYAGIAAVAAYAADILEVHITLSDEMPGPDTPASLTPLQLEQLVEGVRFVEAALASRSEKNSLTDEQWALRDVFGRSVVAARPLSAGQVLGLSDLAAKKPAGGMPADDMRGLVGRRLRRALQQDEIILESDVE
jgi:N-acetylneuraminate synthase